MCLKENTTHKRKKIKRDPQLTQMLELADEDFKTIIIKVFHAFKNSTEKWNI